MAIMHTSIGYYDEYYPAPALADRSMAASAPLAVDKPACASRKLVEFFFYVITVGSISQDYTGLSSIRFALGGPNALNGFLAFCILLMQRERLPTVLWFAAVMNVTATISQVLVSGEPPILGEGLVAYVHWFFNLATVYYIVQNSAARKRLIIVYSLLTIAVLVLTGARLTGYVAGTTRLQVSEQNVGSLSDANAAAYLAGMLSITLLFWSLRSARMTRPLLWAAAAVLALVVLRTVSRGGFLTFSCGLATLLVAVFLARRIRLSGIVLVFVMIIGGLLLASIASDSLGHLRERFGEHSVRERVYTKATLGDIWDTKFLGRGFGARTSAGITAHNAFLYTHICMGGITAWPYAIMLLVLALRTMRLVLARDLPIDVRLWVLSLLGMSFASQMFSNRGYVDVSVVFAFAIIEHFTLPHTRRGIAALEAQRRRQALMGAAGGTWPVGAYV